MVRQTIRQACARCQPTPKRARIPADVLFYVLTDCQQDSTSTEGFCQISVTRGAYHQHRQVAFPGITYSATLPINAWRKTTPAVGAHDDQVGMDVAGMLLEQGAGNVLAAFPAVPHAGVQRAGMLAGVLLGRGQHGVAMLIGQRGQLRRIVLAGVFYGQPAD